MKDLPKWITLVVLLLGFFAGAIAWAATMESRLSNVEGIRPVVDRIDRLTVRLAERAGIKDER